LAQHADARGRGDRSHGRPVAGVLCDRRARAFL